MLVYSFQRKIAKQVGNMRKGNTFGFSVFLYLFTLKEARRSDWIGCFGSFSIIPN